MKYLLSIILISFSIGAEAQCTLSDYEFDRKFDSVERSLISLFNSPNKKKFSIAEKNYNKWSDAWKDRYYFNRNLNTPKPKNFKPKPPLMPNDRAVPKKTKTKEPGNRNK